MTGPLQPETPPSAASVPIAATPPPRGIRTFANVLVNTAVANLTTSFLWFALTFWVYLETQSVLATGIIGGAYMLFLAIFAMFFGTIVDRHRKHRVMVFSSLVTLAAFVAAGVLYLLFPEAALLDLGGPWFWLFSGVVLFGAVIENMRNIALSTTVTLLVPVERHANANGFVGTVQGIAFIVTSVFSAFAIGFLGMGWTLVIAIALTLVALAHLLTLRIPEEKPQPDAEGERRPAVDVAGSIRAVRAAPGLFALIIFSTFNNLIGGVYMALMDPYGIDMFGVPIWGTVFAVAATGFIIGGLMIGWLGLGKNPIRTLLLVVAVMGLLGAVFTVREWWWLYAAGIWVYMMLIPVVEASEQTVIQKVVPFQTQGRVFGFAAAFESAAAPVTAFLIAPLAEFLIIPYMDGADGRATWGWLLGDGQSRGIALVFLFAGLAMVAIALLAFLTPSYRVLSEQYRTSEPSAPDGQDPAAGPGSVAGSGEVAGSGGVAGPGEVAGSLAEGRREVARPGAVAESPGEVAGSAAVASPPADEDAGAGVNRR